jgi:ferredoxin-NADP reductase/MOSC domain-containing protein YiiM
MPDAVGVLVSVNVGQPRDVAWQGKTIRTSIWKTPVEGRVWAGRLNIAGDGQADLVGHGGEQRAIMVYQMESYRHWAQVLDRADFVMGQFGENLTVEGLADREVCIGDRFRIGGALVEVSQPRVTCFKVGIRMAHPPMPALMVAHRRPGFYFRVLEEGQIGAGDRIEKVADGPQAMSVAEMDGLLYTRDHPLPALERALRIPALSPGWQGSLQSLRDAAVGGGIAGNPGLATVGPPLLWNGFRPLTVTAARLESADVRSFELAAGGGEALADALPGQHLVVRLPAPDGKTILRNYSLCGPPKSGRYRIAVKREPQGIGSDYLHDHVQAGDPIESSAPRGAFVLPEGETPIVLVSAGVGVTPVLGMLHAARASARPRPIWWLHAARDHAHHAFADEIRMLMAQTPTQVRTLYSRPGPNDRLGDDYDGAGHFDVEALKALGLPPDAEAFLCGPAAFMQSLTEALEAIGFAPSWVHTEAFGAPIATGPVIAPHPPPGDAGEGPLVSFAKSGVAAPWNDRYASLLDFAEACDVPVNWSCRAGVCHRCESGLIDGVVAYAPEPIDAPAAGAVLLCCSRPTTDVQLDL